MAIHSSGQTIFSLIHIEGITLGASEEVDEIINTFKYHVSCTDGKISVRINLLFYQFFTVDGTTMKNR